MAQDLTPVRDGIDKIDNTIVELLKERLSLAKTIGKLKNESKRAKWDPLRERQIYERLTKLNDGVFPKDALHSIFHEIITTCRLSQQKIAVSYLGPEATFTHLAGVKYFGHSATYSPMESIADVFSEVEKGRTQYGIVPVENSIEGAVFSTLDSFMKFRTKICGEVRMEITHNLVCKSGDIKDIQTVASHTQPLAQCREWLRKHLPTCPTLPVFSTGAAAQMAANNPNIGAIASSLAIKTYELQVVVKGIEDYRGNTTRFLVIGKESPTPSGADRTSLLLGIKERPGALNEILSVIARAGINLAKIESRPIKGKQWKYLFFLDLMGHIDDQHIKDCCTTLKALCSYFEWLGSYPVTEESSPDA
ncbi:prephenate dehydratase [Desulfocapsa sp. AH-315-G09]|uniref:Bifunctional chorismate mutase/prephenate dehydratase n=1 Tax=Desulfotalea psychrophila TaxID=84980 RepID=A0ABS3ASL0_9BACT|nr:prephenate dehydratase [Desulfocapsa sp.]MBN4058744.1 prephenate dehydratase [Desulfocapsa sp. AH-315-J15]MBN4063888.1 prephenate dehydratase [bacterium AH-315-I07]MBN4065018.1 prephenate dehydratase [Desulfocapsa sp. AH-315-G09]MBN4068113.1 prephenate dehydratase [Desulfotalea psychrophila]